MRTKRVYWAVLALAAAAWMLPIASAGAAESPADVDIERYGGSDRYATSLLAAKAVAETRGGKLDEIVLVSGKNWTNAVLGAPLAGQLGGAVLATPPSHLRDDAAAFLRTAGVKNVWIVRADTDVEPVSIDVDFALLDLGIEITRVSGPDHYEVAAHLAISRSSSSAPGRMGSLGRTAIVASGEVFADGLVASAFAARGPHPILLNPRDGLHDHVRNALNSINGLEHVALMGGEAALSAQVESSIKSLGLRVTRLAGATRFETASKAAELVVGRYDDDCFSDGRVGLARARVPFDSFSAGPLLARLCAPLLLTNPKSIPNATAAYLDKTRQSAAAGGSESIDLHVFGGDAAVSHTAIDKYLVR
ncbi:MAG: cell wall-binding repeat-containing protein [Acidimicrobiaceae bacterium]|nr:cell wall-binding repeat-containing protein [Acidimicrobiaceae bacterium]